MTFGKKCPYEPVVPFKSQTTCEFLLCSTTSAAGLTSLAMAMPEESTNTMTTATTAETTSVQLTNHGQSEAFFRNASGYHSYRLDCVCNGLVFRSQPSATAGNHLPPFAWQGPLCPVGNFKTCNLTRCIAKCIGNAEFAGGFLVSKPGLQSRRHGFVYLL